MRLVHNCILLILKQQSLLLAYHLASCLNHSLSFEARQDIVQDRKQRQPAFYNQHDNGSGAYQ